jgi:hypothetical protein
MATLGYVHSGEFLRLDERTMKEEVLSSAHLLINIT